jgi:ABC-type multidrug transport system fused ATPase/permease subunit
LKNVIETNVLPAIYSFIAAIDANVVPKVKEAARIVGDLLGKAMQFVGWVITNIVVPAIGLASAWWQKHKADIEPILPVLGQIVKWVLIVAAVLTGVLAVALLGPVVAAFAAVVVIIIVVVKIITTLISIIKTVVGWFKSASDSANNMGATLRNAASTAIGFFSNLSASIRNAVGNLGGVLISAGEQVISGLMQGVRNMLGSLRNLMGSVAGSIANWKGPLDYDRKILIPAGKAIMGGLMNGIDSKMDALRNKLRGVSGTIKVEGDMATRPFITRRPPGEGPGGPGEPGHNGMVKNYYITQNITTQELNPTRQAAALGWEVQTVM